MSHSLDLYATIHPPVQGGNDRVASPVFLCLDTPSRTGRKLLGIFWVDIAT